MYIALVMRYGTEELDHTADAGLRIRSMDLPGLFLKAATGMFSLIHEGSVIAVENAIPPPGADCTIEQLSEQTVPESSDRLAGDLEATMIDIDATGLDELFHGWLTELLFHHSIRHSIPRHVILERCDAGQLRAKVEWVRMNENIISEATEIKAVTWHGLLVEKQDSIWTAEVIFDT